MVKRNEQLDRVFGALADPTRRGILEQLSHGESTVGTLAAPHNVSQPAISRHLRVLERAGLIRRERKGREHHIRVDPSSVEEAQDWIAHYARFWKRQFDAVDDYLTKHGKKRKK